jgi:choline dehydrogenase-like flavoprotein
VSGRIYTAHDLTADVDISCDVCIVGSGAGGAMLAAGLCERGLTVVMLEEGGWHTKEEFDLHEGNAFPMLYQERGTRATADLAIAILQGRAVGGTTVINWTTCFRTPDRILTHWQKVHGIEGLGSEDLRPHFEAVEERLNIQEWPPDRVNENNRTLLDGCTKLGWKVSPLRRNVKGCANSGYCGLGCPLDAKQSMLVTCVPDAVASGLSLYANTKAIRFETAGDKVTAVHAVVLDAYNDRPNGRKVVVRPKVAVCSGGAINSPALLLRSELPEGGVGTRTWLHPVVALPGEYERRIEGWKGAPQSMGSHQFIDRGPDKVGYFLECPPMQPMLASTAFHRFGTTKQDWLAKLPHVSTLIAVCVDGLVPGDLGGTVSLKSDGRINVDYPVSAAMSEAFRDATTNMARCHLAAGVKRATTLHVDEVVVDIEGDVPKVAAAPYGAHEHPIFTAHQMGGCVMGVDPATSVVDSTLRHHRVKNPFVVDGSALPTALGVNPSETIYGIAHWARDIVASAV